jgi:ammonia channel protein AmtB
LAVGLFDLDSGVVYGNGADVVLIPNIMGIVAITAWVTIVSGIIWGAMKAAKIIRVDETTEVMGDSAKYNVEREADHVFEVRESVRKSQQ